MQRSWFVDIVGSNCRPPKDRRAVFAVIVFRYATAVNADAIRKLYGAGRPVRSVASQYRAALAFAVLDALVNGLARRTWLAATIFTVVSFRGNVDFVRQLRDVKTRTLQSGRGRVLPRKRKRQQNQNATLQPFLVSRLPFGCRGHNVLGEEII